jgi:PKHD-type hydroxylase
MTIKTPAAWAFKLDHVESWAYWDKLFTKEECKKIIELGRACSLASAMVGDGRGVLDQDTRKSNTAWLFPCEEHNWIFARIAHAVTSLNNDFFKFDLFGLTEGLQFTEYVSPSGFYGTHVDSTKGIAPRKLSVSIQLSSDEDYEGGKLQLHYDKTPVVAPTEQGKAIVFPSYMLHEVTPVTKGTRYSLVCWVTGSPFR